MTNEYKYEPLESSSPSTMIDMIRIPHHDNKNPFSFTIQQLISLVDRKDLDFLQQIGGIEGLAKGLHSNLAHGINENELDLPSIHIEQLENHQQQYHEEKENNDSDLNSDISTPLILPNNNVTPCSPRFVQRKYVYGTNTLPDVNSNSLLQLMWNAFQDKTLILLTISAIISFSVGIYEDITVIELDANGNKIPGVKWVEGVAIIVAVVLVVVVGSVNDYEKEKQFRKLNAKKEERYVYVVRSGQQCSIPIYDIQVGDVLSLEPGDIIPVDGVFIQGHNLKCDESASTGESDAVRKSTWQYCIGLKQNHSLELKNNHHSTTNNILEQKSLITIDDNSINYNKSIIQNDHHQKQLSDPFLVSGSKVLEGICTYMVTAVGPHSFHGRTLMALRVKSEITPLQEKLNTLAENIAKLGVCAAGFLFMILTVCSIFNYLQQSSTINPTEIISQLTQILITTITVIVVAVPEGLPLAVTLALAYATQRMLKENNLVRILQACETMGNATTICSDKTGTLTQNKMTVVAGTFGSSFRFMKEPPVYRTDLTDLPDIRKRIPLPVKCFINQAIAINSTAFRLSTTDKGDTSLVGNKTETAILQFSRNSLDSEPFECLRACWPVEQVYPFDSTTKAMGTVIRVLVKNKDNKTEHYVYRLHIKGAPEVLLSKCSSILSMHDPFYHNNPSFNAENETDRYHIKSRSMTEHNYMRLTKIIQTYGSRCLRTIAMCYRDYDTWPSNWSLQDAIQQGGFTMLGIVGIEDPLRSGVKQAVLDCQQAGVCVRMVTGDNMITAKSIARKCGIYGYGDLAMDGPTFRKLSPELRKSLLPHLRVLARSSPEDKRLLVQSLKTQGDIVAVTGDGTNDAPALKVADVGFSMGLSGTEVAKEASSIILMNDNFSSIVNAISWGRCVNDSVKKFLQFQLTVNITAVLLTIVSAVTSDEQKSILTAVQLLWVNLIMDTFAALALATDPPTPSLLQRSPEPRSSPLITPCMWKMIIGQAIYQISIITSLLYTNILQIEDPISLQTFVFNTFVFCQLFNELNCRRIDNGFNIVKGITKNRFFIVIISICILGQILIVECGGTAFQTTPLDKSKWILSLILGFFSIPFGMFIRMLPDDIFIPNTYKYSSYVTPSIALLQNSNRGSLSSSNYYSDNNLDDDNESIGFASHT
ncbi:unnamed protein product [Cunninghamella blakesleeana]